MSSVLDEVSVSDEEDPGMVLVEAAVNKAIPPLSDKTLALAAELEERRQNERLVQSLALALGAALVKLGGGARISLSQADYDNLLAEYKVEVLPPEQGELISVRLVSAATEAANG